MAKLLGTAPFQAPTNADLGDLAYQDALIFSSNFGRKFTSRSEFLAWAPTANPSNGDLVLVYVGGNAGALSYVYDGSGSDFTESALDGWHAVAPVYLEHFGITTSADKTSEGTDYTTQVQAAMDATEGELIFTGFVKITDKVVCPNRCTLKVPEGRSYGGFSIFDDFNLSATCVLQPGTGETGATVDGIALWFQQPAAPANRAALTQYPPAVNIGAPAGEDAIVGNPEDTPGLARGYIKSIRIEQAWDGIIGIGNCGGYKFGVLELGCFNRNMEIDGALDFVHAETIHVWPFGFASNSDLTDVFYDGDTVGLRLKKVDNWSCYDLSVFRVKVELGESAGTSTLPYQFDTIALDGDSARIVFNGDSSQIGALYSTKSASASATLQDISCLGGQHVISAIQMVAAADAAVLCSGGQLSILTGSMNHLFSNRRAFVVNSTGFLSLSNIPLKWPNTARSLPMIDQAGTTSVLRASAIYADGTYTNDEELIRFNSDQEGNYLFCPDIYPHSANFNGQWTKGFYDAGYLNSRSAPDNRAAIQYYKKFSDDDEGWELGLQRARGTSDSPSAVSNGDQIGDISFSAWDGNSFNNGALVRATVDGTVSDGVTPVKLSFFIEDSGGTLQTPAVLNATGLGLGVGINPGQALDVNDDSIRVRTAKTPASASDTGTTGQIAWDADYIYVCTATDTWKRVAIATW